MRGAQLVRQWKIINLLETRKQGCTAQELAQLLDANIRSVYRDLDALQDAGFPLYSEREEGQYFWRLLTSEKTNCGIPFNLSELVALRFAQDILGSFKGTPFPAGLNSIIRKIKKMLAPEMLQTMEGIQPQFTLSFTTSKAYDSTILATVSEALTAKKQLEITYGARSTGEETSRVVLPYQIKISNGIFYLVAYCLTRGDVRTFAVNRIKSAKMHEETFDAPESFRSNGRFETAFSVMTGEPKDIVIKFSPKVAKLVTETTWHASQRSEVQPDGRVVVSMHAAVNYEILSWILGFGPRAEILEPPELRERVEKEFREGLAVYNKKK
jgi:predicted DNA-binding transcriptional regulator YafY